MDDHETCSKPDEMPSASATRVISVTSGKGGVGKTNIVANLAYIFTQLGKKVFVFDADIGLANIDVLLGLTPEYNIQHVLAGEKQLTDIVVDGPGGFRIFPASSGVQELAELNRDQKIFLLSEMNTLETDIDIFLIDTGAGISTNVMYFNMAAQEKIVIVTPEPTSITDAYAIMKVLSKRFDEHSFKLIVNEARNEDEARALYRNLVSVADQYLDISIDFMGWIALDPCVTKAVRNQELVTTAFPDAPSSLCFFQVARTILKEQPAHLPGGNIGFFWDALLENRTQ